MTTIGVIAGIIVAVGTTTAGVISVGKWIFSRGRQAERDSAYKNRITTELEDIKRRLSDTKSD